MSNTDIFNRLHSASSYHPASVELFDDFTLEAGDVITVTKNNTNYTLPIFRRELNWSGTSVVTLESSGNRERAGLPALERRDYANESQNYQYQKNLVTQVDTLIANAIETVDFSAVYARIEAIEADYITTSTFNAEKAYVRNMFNGQSAIQLADITQAKIVHFQVASVDGSSTTYHRFSPVTMTMGTVLSSPDQLRPYSPLVLVESDASGNATNLNLQHYHELTLTNGVLTLGQVRSTAPTGITVSGGSSGSSGTINASNFNVGVTDGSGTTYHRFTPVTITMGTLLSSPEQLRPYSPLILVESDASGNASNLNLQHYHTITVAEDSNTAGQINITLGAVANTAQTANFNIADTTFYRNAISAVQTNLSFPTVTLRSTNNDNALEEWRGYLTITTTSNDGHGNTITKTDQSKYIVLDDFYQEAYSVGMANGAAFNWHNTTVEVDSNGWNVGTYGTQDNGETYYLPVTATATATDGTNNPKTDTDTYNADVTQVYSDGYNAGITYERSRWSWVTGSTVEGTGGQITYRYNSQQQVGQYTVQITGVEIEAGDGSSGSLDKTISVYADLTSAIGSIVNEQIEDITGDEFTAYNNGYDLGYGAGYQQGYRACSNAVADTWELSPTSLSFGSNDITITKSSNNDWFVTAYSKTYTATDGTHILTGTATVAANLTTRIREIIASETGNTTWGDDLSVEVTSNGWSTGTYGTRDNGESYYIPVTATARAYDTNNHSKTKTGSKDIDVTQVYSDGYSAGVAWERDQWKIFTPEQTGSTVRSINSITNDHGVTSYYVYGLNYYIHAGDGYSYNASPKQLSRYLSTGYVDVTDAVLSLLNQASSGTNYGTLTNTLTGISAGSPVYDSTGANGVVRIPIIATAHAANNLQQADASNASDPTYIAVSSIYRTGYNDGLSAGSGSGGSGGSGANITGVDVSLTARLNREDFGTSSSGTTYASPSGVNWTNTAAYVVYDSGVVVSSGTVAVTIPTSNMNGNHIVRSVNVTKIERIQDSGGYQWYVTINFNGSTRRAQVTNVDLNG